MAINRIILMGRLTRDPELKHTQSGLAVTSFTIAVDGFGKDAKANFIPCVAWRQTAEFICNYWRKGAMIAIDGSLSQREYEDRDGKSRSAIEVVVDRASFTGEKSEARVTPQYAPSTEAGERDFDAEEDDLPF